MAPLRCRSMGRATSGLPVYPFGSWVNGLGRLCRAADVRCSAPKMHENTKSLSVFSMIYFRDFPETVPL